jgi:hypothetical protein
MDSAVAIIRVLALFLLHHGLGRIGGVRWLTKPVQGRAQGILLLLLLLLLGFIVVIAVFVIIITTVGILPPGFVNKTIIVNDVLMVQDMTARPYLLVTLIVAHMLGIMVIALQVSFSLVFLQVRASDG